MIGVLALQGGYASHVTRLQAMSEKVFLVREKEHLNACSALIIPGGESTTISWLIRKRGLTDPLKRFCEERPVLGTCAGVILLAKGLNDPRVEQLGLLDIDIARNGYGAQVDSFEGTVSIGNQKIDGIFIRAPKITRVGGEVAVLGTLNKEPALVQQGRIMGATFHPELGSDTLVYEYFLRSLVYATS